MTTSTARLLYKRLNGLNLGQRYMAHVYNQSCATGGGSHYKIDASEPATNGENEYWFEFTGLENKPATDFSISDNHVSRAQAQSIVLHEPGTGARLACADLDLHAGLHAIPLIKSNTLCEGLGVIRISDHQVAIFQEKGELTGRRNYLCVNRDCQSGSLETGFFSRRIVSDNQTDFRLQSKVQDDANGQVISSAQVNVSACTLTL